MMGAFFIAIFKADDELCVATLLKNNMADPNLRLPKKGNTKKKYELKFQEWRDFCHKV